MGTVAHRPRAWLEWAETEEGELVVRIGGELDLDSVPGVDPAVDGLIARHNGRHVTVDLGELSFFDSSGVTVLIRIANGSGSMRIRHANPAVRRVIEVLGLASWLGLESD
ncbi:STAS domain-containing protein [Planosporangium thailandense]|uniref:Anti-sigma factor antagonist n=1 Tax=Planosporangium thailandense TaxID=765197 RepID=A0ABX0XVH3_9ACTN|nr:STAS domain-containing protein [Planosporangium thailandense]NJC70041.1 STAS domain-containing protein [Planosporangium thailandense]